jgi:hypothetical protein
MKSARALRCVLLLLAFPAVALATPPLPAAPKLPAPTTIVVNGNAAARGPRPQRVVVAPAGRKADVAAPPKVLQKTPYRSGSSEGVVYEAADYIHEKLGLGAKDTITLYHRTSSPWGGPGERVPISTTHNDGGYFGRGFYLSTQPEDAYGPYELKLEIPVSAFVGNKIFVAPHTGYENVLDPSFVMPHGSDIIASDVGGGAFWFILKPGSEAWVNRLSTTSEFVRTGKEPVRLPPLQRAALPSGWLKTD